MSSSGVGLQQRATARLRSAVRYPSDDDVGSDLDEEEQEKLIYSLRTKNASQNLFYTKVFTFLPLAISTYYAYLLFIRPPLFPLLALTSLLATSFTTAFSAKPQTFQRPFPNAARFFNARSGGWQPTLPQEYIVYLNGVLVVLISLYGVLESRRRTGGDAFGLFRWGVPLLVNIVCNVALRTMGEVDIRPLESLKYNYKGA
ncbi:MAG: hypothetical protein M1824_001651 [Vezdaea acicularis]|nr:MAG: hypothetical protein M1824_001651 [Vezdaea acicularis]